MLRNPQYRLLPERYDRDPSALSRAWDDRDLDRVDPDSDPRFRDMDSRRATSSGWQAPTRRHVRQGGEDYGLAGQGGEDYGLAAEVAQGGRRPGPGAGRAGAPLPPPMPAQRGARGSRGHDEFAASDVRGEEGFGLEAESSQGRPVGRDLPQAGLLRDPWSRSRSVSRSGSEEFGLQAEGPRGGARTPPHPAARPLPPPPRTPQSPHGARAHGGGGGGGSDGEGYGLGADLAEARGSSGGRGYGAMDDEGGWGGRGAATARAGRHTGDADDYGLLPPAGGRFGTAQKEEEFGFGAE